MVAALFTQSPEINIVKKLQMLRNSRQFRQVYDQGQRFHTSLFSVFVLKTIGDEQRFGITITRKIGNAVVRNRCKRRLREALRKQLSESANLAVVGLGFDLVINAKSDLVKADFKQIADALAKVMERLCNSLLKDKT